MVEVIIISFSVCTLYTRLVARLQDHQSKFSAQAIKAPDTVKAPN